MKPTIFENIQQSHGALLVSMNAIRQLLAKLDKESRHYAELQVELEQAERQADLLGRQLQEFKDRAKQVVDSYKVQVDKLSSDLATARKAEARQAARCRELTTDSACAW